MTKKTPTARFKEGDKVMQAEKISFTSHPTHGPKKGIIKRVINTTDTRGARRFEYEVHWNNSQRTDTVTQHRLKLSE